MEWQDVLSQRFDTAPLDYHCLAMRAVIERYGVLIRFHNPTVRSRKLSAGPRVWAGSGRHQADRSVRQSAAGLEMLSNKQLLVPILFGLEADFSCC